MIKILKNLIKKLTETEAIDPVIPMVGGFTMLTKPRLNNLLILSRRLIDQKITGDFVECGTCRGGSAAILAYAAKEEGWRRQVWLFDSFQGHPEPQNQNAPDKEILKKWVGTMVASPEDVRLALSIAGAYSPEHVKIIPGWFKDSLPKTEIKKIALLHIDSDWYESTLCCLENLYGKVVSGGYIVIDDYSYEDMPGVKQAVDEFFKTRNLEINLTFKIKPAIILQRK